MKVRISGVEVLLARSRVVEGTTGKIRTGSERTTRSASKAVKHVKVEATEEAVLEPVRMRSRMRHR